MKKSTIVAQTPAEKPKPKPTVKVDGGKEAKIKASLAKLSAADRALAEKQRYCAVLMTSRLGSMGPPIKVMIEGQPVFVCCQGCSDDAQSDPKATLERVHALQRANAADEPASPSPAAEDK